MDFERIAMLLGIFHACVGEPSFKAIQTAARDEIMRLGKGEVESDAVEINPDAPADPTHPETAVRRV